MSGKTPLWKDLLINFAKGAKITSLFHYFCCYAVRSCTFLILRPEIMLDISSSIVGVMKNVSLFGFRR